MAKLVVFDLDGTLIDSRMDLSGAVNYMRATMGIEALETQRVVHFIGNGVDSLVRRAVADVDVDFETALARMNRHYADHLIDSTYLYPEVFSGLRELKDANFYLAVLTNKSTVNAVKVLRELEIESIFDAIVGADSEWPLKPEPDALISLQKRYNVDLENCRVVGDNYTDLECARKAGYKSIFVRYGFGEIQDEKPNFQVDSFNEIIPILFNLK
jgi:phosphoglycolate phosphatase